ncbi:hypothetical protein PGT21_000191 [Puccinia graminis f. sp. tritici]|uniref:Uncharacterized protein n=1 Tax=Puccinia graminis f. sp. tritici TaxID=56615 RepID=A0A5B0N9V5_PUCGR|nr:hypothetical protein PGT21_000191 [Puccinia graminis f. sp. tritici]
MPIVHSLLFATYTLISRASSYLPTSTWIQITRAPCFHPPTPSTTQAKSEKIQISFQPDTASDFNSEIRASLPLALASPPSPQLRRHRSTSSTSSEKPALPVSAQVGPELGPVEYPFDLTYTSICHWPPLKKKKAIRVQVPTLRPASK